MVDDDHHYYGQAQGDFILPPQRPDATETDPYAALRPEPEPALVIKPETDAEIRQRELAEQPPSPADDDPQQLSLLDKLLDRVGAVAGAATEAMVDVAKTILPRPIPKMGAVERQAVTREIIRCVGIFNGEIDPDTDEVRFPGLERSIQHLHGSGKVLEPVDLLVYQVMEAVVETCRGRGQSLDFVETRLHIMEGFQRLNWMEKLAVGWGWKWAIRTVLGPPPPTGRSETTIKGRIQVGIQAGIIQPPSVWRHPQFPGRVLTVSSQHLTSAELEVIFRPDRRYDEAMAELDRVIMQRQGGAVPPTRQPPRQGLTNEMAMRAIYGNQLDPFQGP
jgi:hypothetical protein